MSFAISILQIDAFTARPFAGNPAGVVLDAGALSDEQMQAVAAEMNVAETAFVSSTNRSGAHLRLRWFTPGREVTYCGHATVATVHAMVETGRLVADRVVFDTLGGLLPVAVERRPGEALIWLEPAVPECRPYGESLEELLGAAGLGRDQLAAWAAPAVTPEADLLIPVRDLASLRGLRPDMGRLGAAADALKLRGICGVSLETVDPGSHTHIRFFAPHFGIPEDPVTGSVHSSLAVWLFGASRLSLSGDTASFTAEQGDSVGRPGRLSVELRAEGGRPAAVRVGGRAVTVLAGSMRLG
jgi:trans-2,3-dihydro-3-hydroxyanthranilate isomerase